MKNNDTQPDSPAQALSLRAGDPDLFVVHKKKILAAIVVAHVIATLFFFPPRAIFNTKPVITLDHAFHYYQVRRAGDVFWETGRLHAYDPYFMAGYPSAIFDLDVKAAELFCSPFRGSSAAVAYKLFILLCYLTIVVTVYKGCRFLGWSERESIYAILVLLVFWHWGRPYASHFRYAGMFEFILVSHLAILVIGLFRQFLLGRKTLWFFIWGTLVFFVHPTAVVMLDVPFVVLLILERRRLTIGRTLLFMLWCVCVLVVNAVWVIPFFEYAGIKTASDAFFQTSGVRDLTCSLVRPGCLPAVAMIFCALPGLWRLRAGNGWVGGVAVALGTAFLLFVTAYGVYLPGLRHLEPGRFLLPALFFAAPLAGCGVAQAVDLAGRLLGSWVIRPRAETVIVSVFLIAFVCFSYLSAWTTYNHRLSTTPSGEVQGLLDAIAAHADPSSRIMVEDGPAALYDEVHLPGIIPALTGVQQIGGPYPFTFIAHHFATFQTDKTMGRHLSSISSNEFLQYLDLYNIGWIVTATPEGGTYVSRLAARGVHLGAANDRLVSEVAEPVWGSARYTLWRVNRPRSFTDNPADKVRASYNRIDIELETIPERFLLRYHWDERLAASPPVTVNKVYYLDDPVPFILVEPNGVSSIAIMY